MKIMKLDEMANAHLNEAIEKNFKAKLECPYVKHNVTSDIDEYGSYEDFCENGGRTHTKSEFHISSTIGADSKMLTIVVEWDFYDRYGTLKLENVRVNVMGDDLSPFYPEDIANIAYEQYTNGSWNEAAIEAWNAENENIQPECLFDDMNLEKLKDYIMDAYNEAEL